MRVLAFVVLTSCSRAIVAAPESQAIAPPPMSMSLALGQDHACAWKSDGTAWCWGSNDEGQLGDGTTLARSTPVRVLVDDIAEMSAGYRFTCARKKNGTVLCWGDNHVGKLGDGSLIARKAAAPVTGLTNAVELESSSMHSCARIADGTVTCWGNNGSGQLGAHPSKPNVPVKVAGIVDAVELALATAHSCARDKSGNVQCWGTNDGGQLGIGVVKERPACGQPDAPMIEVIEPSWSENPVSVAALKSATRIAALLDRTCGVVDGNLRCTTNPIYGRHDPKLSSVVDFAAGTHHGCARLEDGTLRCFGPNTNGELGAEPTSQGTVTPMGLGAVLEVRCGDAFTCARKNDGSIWCWGKNDEGQLGDGTRIDRKFPVRVVVP